MSVIAWLLAAAFALVLLSTARWPLRRLPPPVPAVPDFTLWLPEGGDAPALSPAPAAVHRGPVPPDADRLLVLGRGVRVPVDLPGRLAACGGDFVSVLPRPVGGLVAQAVERWRRDFAGLARVVDVRDPAGWADGRCAWLRRADLDLPAAGDDPVLRAARARKAHGLPVDLREGGGLPHPDGDGAAVTAPARTFADHVAGAADQLDRDPLVWALVVAVPPLLCLGPLVALPFAPTPAAIALGLGTLARLMLAVRDDFGLPLALAGWLLEPALALGLARARPRANPQEFPALPEGAPPALTAARPTEGRPWLDDAGVPFLARRLGGAAPVMERIYANRPAGRTTRGLLADRVALASPASRAVRHRRLATIDAGRALAPASLLSVPCGGAGDAAAIAAPRTVLVDPDPAARALAAARCPGAEVLDGTVERAPDGPFDLVLYVGLSEYLDDAAVVAHLRALRARLAPDGALLATTTAEHPQRNAMRAWLGWETRARSPDALTTLLDNAGFAVTRRVADPLGIQWVLTARPRS